MQQNLSLACGLQRCLTTPEFVALWCRSMPELPPKQRTHLLPIQSQADSLRTSWTDHMHVLHAQLVANGRRKREAVTQKSTGRVLDAQAQDRIFCGQTQMKQD